MSTEHAQVSSGGSRYRGTVPQPKGRWGFQIDYNQQQRLWLGTFDTEEAAAGYHGPDTVVNFADGDDEGDDNSNEKYNHPTTTTEESQGEENGQGEIMFEKTLTPSDVGKLNRLVIPKQYAERYFPLAGGGDSVLKGLQLNFEDERGTVWRFGYSYWNSSQSYVLTKGWSRYVKEKKLDAGDVVSFHRRGDGLSIGWRRRRLGPEGDGASVPYVGWGPVVYPLPAAHPAHPSATLVYVSTEQEDGLHRDHAGQQREVSPPAANSKRLRLFGVNLDCPLDPAVLLGPNSTPS
ncbi:B3 domain-containing protein At2g36080-like [Aristolochia californica]|uniref:B3 domain-containing protein At2g36080-like n=1 Tax=Aristolochia californica TaxID=171875 RepID=UPI0035DF7E63